MDESQRERIREALADFVNKTFRTEGGNKTGYIELLAEIDKQKRLQNLKNRDLASRVFGKYYKLLYDRKPLE